MTYAFEPKYLPQRPYADVHKRCAHKGYEMTCREYDDLRARRGGACGLCERPARWLVVDHDHSVGRQAVRGLVCSQCNTKLAMVDNGKRVADEAVTRYLESAWHLTHRAEDVEAWARAAGRELHPIEEDR